jgi:hypothetical protein
MITPRVDRSDPIKPLLIDGEPFFLIHYTALCNAACAHCIVESGPQRKERMPIDLAAELIAGASMVPRLRLVVFSGGESFIYLDNVLRLCETAQALGMQTRIISNGYWARSPDAAARMLERLAASNVDQLVISFGRFHRAYIPPERVRNVFHGATLASQAPFVAYSTVNTSGVRAERTIESGAFAWPASVFECLSAYGFDVGACVPLQAAVRRLAGLTGEERVLFKRAMVHERALINWEPLAFGGRAAKQLGDFVRLRSIDDDPGCACGAAGRQITALTDGRMYPCCSTWTNYPAHAAGVARTASDVPALVRAMHDDPLVRFIHDRGPGALIQHFRRAGRPLPAAYSDICHMCQTLFEHVPLDEVRAAAMAEGGGDDVCVSRQPDHKEELHHVGQEHC